VSWVGQYSEAGIGKCVGLAFAFGSSNQGLYYNDENAVTAFASAGTNLTHSPITTPNVLHSWYVEFNGGSSKIYRDNILVASGNAGASVPNGSGALFNLFPGGLAGNHYIGEISVHTGTQTTGDIADEHARLQAKWGF
jgi:hypothetical protein